MGSLRDAVTSSADFDQIVFNLPPHSTITLTSGEIGINTTLTISGPGADQLTVSGNNSSGVFHITNGSANVSISGLTIANGHSSAVGGIFMDFASTPGILSVTGSIFSGNSGNDSGAIQGSDGNSLTVIGCAFMGNTSTGGTAGIGWSGPATIINSTFNGNLGHGPGAVGLFLGAMTVVNCTIAGNSGSVGGGIFFSNNTSLNLVNTIIAGNTNGDIVPEFDSQTLATNDHNLIGDGSFNPMLSGDPKLGPLQNNGGFTPTMALLAGSTCVDAGDDSVLGPPFSLTTDQRGAGFPRKSGLHVDTGAFEVQQPPGPTFDTCLKDNTTGNLIEWNSTTGQYIFARCSGNFTVTGTGTVAVVNGIRTLTDNKADRRISAGFNTGQLTGNATLYLRVAQGVWQTFRIIDTNPSAGCKC
jgi:hypothetical protein